VKSKNSDEEERLMLLEAGWEARLQGGLITWRRPGGRGRWYSQSVAIGLLEFLEEEKDGEDGVP
jgi:hypothetical protein